MGAGGGGGGAHWRQRLWASRSSLQACSNHAYALVPSVLCSRKARGPGKCARDSAYSFLGVTGGLALQSLGQTADWEWAGCTVKLFLCRGAACCAACRRRQASFVSLVVSCEITAEPGRECTRAKNAAEIAVALVRCFWGHRHVWGTTTVCRQARYSGPTPTLAPLMPLIQVASFSQQSSGLTGSAKSCGVAGCASPDDRHRRRWRRQPRR